MVFSKVDTFWMLGMKLQVAVWETMDIAALALAAAALVAMLRFKVGMIPTLLVSAALGVIYQLAL